MLIGSLLLLFFAAILHALANALMKNSRVKLAFVWWMLGVSCVLGIPLWFFIPEVEPLAWTLLLISGVLEVIYFFTLTRAYSTGELSVVYPIARGSAPLFLLIWAVLFLKERPTPTGMAGIVAVAAGLYLINLRGIRDWNRPLHAFRSAAPRWALLTGLLISAYTAVDKIGVAYFSPLLYIYFVLFIGWIFLSVQWFLPVQRAALLAEVAERKRALAVVAAAIFGTAGYTLVLAAMRLSPASYVGAVREVSVVIGAWIGVRFLGEQGGSLRIVASSLVAIGILLIALGG
jgi:drug/metabolite transporter (DMT)-like permease